MDISKRKIKISSSEHGILWSQYINDTLSICVLKYFLKDAKEEQTIAVLQEALQLAEEHIVKLKKFFSDENLPTPIGFTEEDVNMDAPTLYSDVYKILYMHIMALHGLTRYAGAVSSCLRADYIQYYSECTKETLDLYAKASKVVVDLGIITRPPIFHNKQKVEFVNKQSYMAGWFTNKRPINALEISGAYLNLQKTMAKMVLELGFSQVAKSKKVREYMERGRKLCHKQFNRLSEMLEEDSLHVPRRFESEVTDSTVSPFSDKLMMYHITTLLSSAVGYYGEALSLCQRRDMSAAYMKLILEIGIFAEDGVNIMIDNGWLEQPPMATDHEHLQKNK
ncbi:DUF3231 family protein [Bacillus salacetis]|uniref:DUF3231 family protein n=1 Tax=Bacillus salacetis TaxID=2315464 RepID=UPI003BA1F932